MAEFDVQSILGRAPVDGLNRTGSATAAALPERHDCAVATASSGSARRRATGDTLYDLARTHADLPLVLFPEVHVEQMR